MRLSKQGAEKQRGGGDGVSSRMATLHQRLYHALNLGLRCTEDKEQKWSFPDIEIQRLVIRSIDAFLECISSETVQHSLFKDSLADMIGALNGILQSKHESISRTASDVTLKVVNLVKSSMLQPYILDLVRSLSSLLSSSQSEIVISCANTLYVILSTLSTRKENEVWEILKETNTVSYLVQNIKDFSLGNKSIESFSSMASLLSKILYRWPPSRFCAWADDQLLNDLNALVHSPETSVKKGVLQLYTSLALCGNGALKLLENGDSLLQFMVDCMDNSKPHLLRIEAFKLAQSLTIGETGCSKVMKLCCEPLVKAIISGLTLQSSDSTKLSKEQISIVTEACRLSLITRFPGEHHIYLWRGGIDRVLLDLVLNNLRNSPRSHSLQELIAIAQEGLNANFLLPLRSFIWDILGWLGANCPQTFKLETHCTESVFNTLLICSCFAFMDSIHMACQINQNCITSTPGSESACRAILMMVYSPSKYISSQARLILSEILNSNHIDCIKYLYATLNAYSSNKFGKPGNLQVVISLMGLSCYLALPNYQNHVIKSHKIIEIVNFIKWWLKNPLHIKRVSLSPHLQMFFSGRICCWNCTEDWEKEEMLLVLGLWVLAELLHYVGPTLDNKAELIKELEEICINKNSSHGSRWYASYVLSYFGKYGFPSQYSGKIGKAFTESELADLELISNSDRSLHVHKAILMVRCSSLVPNREVLPKDKVHLSAHVNYDSLLKLLEYVYMGYIQLDDNESVNKLKVLVKRCNLKPLLHMLCRRNPKWGTPFPSFDLTPALGPTGHHFSEILLEGKINEVMKWECSSCSLSIPHLHVHKVILWATCEYFRALFQSGMQESQLQTVKVPVNWNALVIFVQWIYSDELPKPIFGCLWDNLDINEKLKELEPYIELCWLAEFWLLDDLYEECCGVVVSCLDSCRNLSVKVIKIASDFSQWKLAEIGANYTAPIFAYLRDSGELDALDDDLIEMVRAAAVRYTQGGL